MEPITRDEIRAQTCPKCGAAPGVDCKGKKRGRSHHARMQAAQIAAGHRVKRLMGAAKKLKRKMKNRPQRDLGADFDQRFRNTMLH